MQRTLVPLVLIVLVLLGAWWIWPQAEPRALVAPAPEAAQAAPEHPLESAVKVEAAPLPTERAEAAAASTPAAAAHLRVLCIARDDRRPLAGVRVYSIYADQRGGFGLIGTGHASTGKPGEELLTDALGRAVFEVDAGHALRVSADDLPHFVSQEGIEAVSALAAGETREVVLVHDAGEGAHLCGIVVAREGGAPVANAEIKIDEKLRTNTDADGRFELDFAAHMPPWIRVEAAGFAPVLSSAEPGHETAAQAKRIELLRPARLEISLVGGSEQARLRVELRGDAHGLSQEGVFTSVWREPGKLAYAAEADALGVCRFEALPPGVRLDAQVLGSTGVLFHSSEPLVLQPGEQRRVEWDLGGASIAGTVREADGRPAAGIELWLLRDSGFVRYVEPRLPGQNIVGKAHSAADGSFRIARVSPGAWLIAPAPTQEIAGAPQTVSVAEGAREVRVEITLARGLFVRGKLVAPDGASGVQGYVSNYGTPHIGTNTEADGAFVLGPLAPGALRLTGSPYNTYLGSEPLEVVPPAENVVLRSRPGAEVSGRVVDELGNGVQASITVGGAEGGMTITRTQPDGSFRLDGFAPGSYALFASTTDGRAGLLAGIALDPAAPAANMQVVLRAGATVRVRCEGSGVAQIAFRRDGAMIGGDGLEAGTSLVQVVPAGPVTVECSGPGRDEKQQQVLELAAGETRELVFKPLAK